MISGFFYLRKIQMREEKLAIKAWAEDDRPREKLREKGAASLSDAELLAIILGSGHGSESALDLAMKMLRQFHSNLQEFQKADYHQLITFKGVGPAKAVFILAALEISRRLKYSRALERKLIKCSTDAFSYFEPMLAHKTHEEFWVLYLNNRNAVIHSVLLSKGGLTGTIVDSREVFRKALELKSTNLILAHNHPSGSNAPSQADKELTKKLVDAGRLLDINVLDHLIVSENGYLSFSDEGMIH